MIWRICGIVLLSLFLAIPEAWPRDQHFSFWSDNPLPFLDAIKNSAGQTLPTLPAGYRVRGGILTHHFLASGLMVRFLAGLSGQSSPETPETPETIVLLGPNHFHQGLANISISSLPWKTPFGVLQSDIRLVQQIAKAIQLPEDTEAFAGEHSVGVLIPFLKYYFPESRVVPVLIDVNADTNRLHRLREVLSARMMNPKTLLLLSMDFSHDSTAAVADARDAQAQPVISSMDASKAIGLQVDCRKGLWLLLESLEQSRCSRVQINEHTNSARLTGKSDLPNVTSYFSVYFLDSR